MTISEAMIMYIGITSKISTPTPACIYYYYYTHRPLSSMHLISPVVSIIFYYFMPILYNFYIFLAIFYMIYWTNILIKCLVQVPICCIFFCFREYPYKRSPDAIKIYGELFSNICDFWELESLQKEAHNPHKTPWRAWAPGAWWGVVLTS